MLLKSETPAVSAGELLSEKELLNSCYYIFGELTRQADRVELSTDLRNADHITQGRLGSLFFFLELYSVTGDGPILERIGEELRRVETYAKENKTSNYSLFEGRL